MRRSAGSTGAASVLAALLGACDGAAPAAAPSDLGGRLDASPDGHASTPDGAADDLATDTGPDVASGGDDGAMDAKVVADAVVDDLAAGADAGAPLALAAPCTDTADAVYVTPPGLPLMTPEHRGDVVRCTVDPPQSVAAVQANLGAANVEGVTAAWPVDVYRIAFRTMRNAVGAGISSARVYLPHGAVGPLPMVVVGHPSEGLADTCATSRRPDTMRDLALPWAARGYPVIAPDYAGLGTDGTQGYLDNVDTAQSLLDGARALRRLLRPGALESRIVLVGYSQGGGAVLAAQGLVRSYGADGDVAAAVVYAPEWPSRIDSFQVLNALRDPNALTIAYGITTPVVVTSMAYAWFENHVGTGHGGEAFAPALRATSPPALDGLCLTPYGGYVQGLQLHVRDWLDEPIRAAFVACYADATGPACSGPGRDLYRWVLQNGSTDSGGDPAGAPVLYVQGMLDTIMPPAQEAACNMARLRRDGVDVELCTDDVALHTSVVARNTRHAIAWAEAKLHGGVEPPCTGPALPACVP